MEKNSSITNDPKILIIEPFNCGSHKELISILTSDVLNEKTFYLMTSPGKKWHWKARTSALYFYQLIPTEHNFRILFASSTLNLCELLSLRPDLQDTKSILYFHENQLEYPVQNTKERDFQYGYNQILSCIVAKLVVFNSSYNMSSFLDQIPSHLKRQPCHRVRSDSIVELIKSKSTVLYFPVNFCLRLRPARHPHKPLHILWAHRWEHDKDPESFFSTLMRLKAENLKFAVSVLGESYSEVPSSFVNAEKQLNEHIQNWGYVQNKEEYWDILHCADVVVSTSLHEFYGISMLEATAAGCHPLCPNRLVYPEIYPKACLYDSIDELYNKLAEFCRNPATTSNCVINYEQYSVNNLTDKYARLFSDNKLD